MKKRITLNSFVKQLQSHYQKSSFTRHEIRSFASSRGVQVPTEIWDTAITRNCFSPTVVSKPKISLAELNGDSSTELFEDLQDLIAVLASPNSKLKSLILTGNAGIGKTHTCLESLKKAKLMKDQDFIVLKSKISPLGLYMTLFLHSDKLILFDDLDDLFTNDDCSAILKAALDSYDTREISWASKNTVNVIGMDDAKRQSVEDEARKKLLNGETYDLALPNRFTFTGKILFISNLSADSFDKAVLSRSMNLDLTLSDAQVFARMLSIASEMLEPEVAKRAVEMIVEQYNAGKQENPNMRTVLNYASVLQAGSLVRNPERLARYC